VQLEETAAQQSFFSAEERDRLSTHSYLRQFESIDEDTLLALLKQLGLYSVLAPEVPFVELPFRYGRCLNRWRHAHNALVAFRKRPFTVKDYGHSLAVILNGPPYPLVSPIFDSIAWRPSKPD
jgi:hypothetical protein